jgi:RNA polymerase sigma-70 factor (ECF subfamily)
MEMAAYESRSSVNDIQLVTRVVAGDAAAERELYETYVDRIYRLTFRLAGDDELARDFTQATFIRAFEKIGSFRGESSLSTWLHSIGLSVALNGLRKTKRIRNREGPMEEGLTVGVMPIQGGIRDARCRGLHA